MATRSTWTYQFTRFRNFNMSHIQKGDISMPVLTILDQVHQSITLLDHIPDRRLYQVYIDVTVYQTEA